MSESSNIENIGVLPGHLLARDFLEKFYETMCIAFEARLQKLPRFQNMSDRQKLITRLWILGELAHHPSIKDLSPDSEVVDRLLAKTMMAAYESDQC